MPPAPHPVFLHQRQVFAHRLERHFAAGSHVLGLGTGDPQDALALARLGVRLLVLEPDPGRIEAARSEATGPGSGPVQFEVGGAGALQGAGRLFDGAYSSPGALEDSQWTALAPALARSLNAGAPVVLALGRPAARVRRLLGHDFLWKTRFALGVVLRRSVSGDWAARNPQTFGLLAILERIVRAWPVIRTLGEYTVWEGARIRRVGDSRH